MVLESASSAPSAEAGGVDKVRQGTQSCHNINQQAYHTGVEAPDTGKGGMHEAVDFGTIDGPQVATAQYNSYH